MTDPYVMEKFSMAAYSLAVSPKSLQERIAAAFSTDLIQVAGNAALPADVAQQFQVYQKEWNAVGETSGQGQINVWASKLSDDQAVDIAKWIVNTAARLRDEQRGGD